MAALPAVLSLLLFASFITDFICKSKQRCLPLTILRLSGGLALVTWQAHQAYRFPHLADFHAILRGEILLALIMVHTALKFKQFARGENHTGARRTDIAFWGLLAAGFIFSFSGQSTYDIVDNPLAIPSRGSMFWVSIAVLGAMIFVATRLEEFWKILANKQRRQFRFLMVGMLLVCATFAWLCSYRLTYRLVIGLHLQLVSFLLLAAWLLILYAVVRHQLLIRKIYVSRKVVYATAAPMIFSIYLLSIGLISLVMRLSGWSMPFILGSLLIAAGPVVLLSLALSQKVRHKIRYFINTHFYENKYEYRDEWLAFSEKLQGKMGAREVVDSLAEVLGKALYTETIVIWLTEGENNELSLAFPHEDQDLETATDLPPAPLLAWLRSHPSFYLARPDTKKEEEWREVAGHCRDFSEKNGMVLFSAMTAGDNFSGIIGLGPEVTGGRYGEDDFDLLRALGTQAASALGAAQAAELTARLREQSAWNTMSTFVLHDVKNAQAMLSLGLENAPKHMANPEFQQDLLETIDDALKRMAKVQQRLTILQGKITPAWREINLTDYVGRICAKLRKKLAGISLDFTTRRIITLESDPDIIFTILENLSLNSMEAGADRCVVNCFPTGDEALIEICDNGHGIPPDLLPDRLFAPFVTSKIKGNGIGLWQVSELAKSLNGKIFAYNLKEKGCCFTIALPLSRDTSGAVTK